MCTAEQGQEETIYACAACPPLPSPPLACLGLPSPRPPSPLLFQSRSEAAAVRTRSPLSPACGEDRNRIVYFARYLTRIRLGDIYGTARWLDHGKLVRAPSPAVAAGPAFLARRWAWRWRAGLDLEASDVTHLCVDSVGCGNIFRGYCRLRYLFGGDFDLPKSSWHCTLKRCS